MNQTLSKPETVEQLDAKAGCPVLLCSAADVDPRKNPAFSPNLFKWLKKNPSMIGRADRFTHDGVEFLGYVDDDFFVGSNLWTILGKGARATAFAYVGLAKCAVRVPMWTDYLDRGRCAIDPEHEQTFIDERFRTEWNCRTCLWCGHRQKREIYQVTTQRERWVSEPNTYSADK